MPSYLYALAPEVKPILRLGFIATGLRGQNHLELMLQRSDVEIVALADPQAHMMASALDMVAKAGRKAPKVYGNGPEDYRRMLEQSVGMAPGSRGGRAQCWCSRSDGSWRRREPSRMLGPRRSE
jgi:hypothetical protein